MFHLEPDFRAPHKRASRRVSGIGAYAGACQQPVESVRTWQTSAIETGPSFEGGPTLGWNAGVVRRQCQLPKNERITRFTASGTQRALLTGPIPWPTEPLALLAEVGQA